ncbi:formate dehydrogenase accessory sulfurtransferase FdhD [Thalassotalea ponticola]|uniref:formate dehydrogenase accessory sulfurtransferase FdhD n=1 Tax=Thalassotalea ponticola TaxID=1523392 RepID=UPI0025B576C0|nr:formate dehydrogenase accessory sulfurtransferase FdhD [Thalassotalea ponticola]MDN3653976.1 formate dehydrogenase accessory sulfurtransferase FdhD [Thalassotalea ponticola]
MTTKHALTTANTDSEQSPLTNYQFATDTHDGIHTVNKIRYSVDASSLNKSANQDLVSVEEPLQINLLWQDNKGQPQEREFTITMRTPGNDPQLAIGLLHSEGIIRTADDVVMAVHQRTEQGINGNQIDIELTPGIIPDWEQYQRHLTMQSSCGICGKTSLKSLELKTPPDLDQQPHWLDPRTVLSVSQIMRKQQRQFAQTGGVHAVGLFNAAGELLLVKEDVGRHNAMDKLIGAHMYLDEQYYSPQSVVVLSGRISFELVQKALMAGFPVIVAVGAPSSLAISVAQRFNITLIGFVSGKGFNVYHGAWRLIKQTP